MNNNFHHKIRVVRLTSLLLMALIPVALLVYMVITYTVDVPYWDQWELVPLLEKSYAGTLSFLDLWTKHNEHNILFPKIIMVVLARLTKWNTFYEVGISVLIALGIFFVLVYQCFLTAKFLGKKGIVWIIPLISQFVFSLRHGGNWLFGWQMQIFLNVFAVAAGIMLLSYSVFTWWRFIAALVCGIIGTYSFANGVGYWPIGIFILYAINRNNIKTLRLSIIIWSIVGAVVIYSYFVGLERIPGHLSIIAIHDTQYYHILLRYPGKYMHYFFSYLGSPLTNNLKGAFFFGITGFAGFAYLIWLNMRYRYLKFELIVPYIALSLYSILGALITGIGRAQFGSVQATSPRYVTFSSLFWISNIVMLYMFTCINNTEPHQGRKIILEKCASFSIIIIIMFFSIISSFNERLTFTYYYRRLMPAREELVTAENDELLERLYPSVEVVRIRRAILKKYKLSVFRDNVR